MAVTHVFTPAITQNTTSGGPPTALAYTGAVAAGDLLWCIVTIYGASVTVTGVSDSLNGSWTQAFGPVRGDGSSGNVVMYGFYKANSSSGTPSVTPVFSANVLGSFAVGAINGLTGGGDLDQGFANLITSGYGSGWQLTSATLAQAEEAGIGWMSVSSGGSGTPRWTSDATTDRSNFDRLQRTVTSSTAATTMGTTSAVAGGSSGVLGMMLFKNGVAVGSTSLPLTGITRSFARVRASSY